MFGKFISYYIWIEAWRFLITCLSTRKNAHSSIDPRDYWKILIKSTLESFARTALEHSIDLTKVLRLQILSTMAMYCILWKNARALCQFHLPVLHSKKTWALRNKIFIWSVKNSENFFIYQKIHEDAQWLAEETFWKMCLIHGESVVTSFSIRKLRTIHLVLKLIAWRNYKYHKFLSQVRLGVIHKTSTIPVICTCLQKAEASQISLHSQVLRQALNGGLGALWFQNTES